MSENKELLKDEEIKKLVEENLYLREKLEEARQGWGQCAQNWEDAVKANKSLIVQLDEARREWNQCAQNWSAAVKYGDELRKEYEKKQKDSR